MGSTGRRKTTRSKELAMSMITGGGGTIPELEGSGVWTR